MSSVGTTGESLALQYLRNKGFSFVEKNYRTRFGEIDLIVKKDNTLVFVEVKTRKDTFKGQPYEAITLRKRRHILKVAQYYLINKRTSKVRLDAVSILLKDDKPVIQHFENIPLDDLV
jgi:putative endonuclease